MVDAPSGPDLYLCNLKRDWSFALPSGLGASVLVGDRLLLRRDIHLTVSGKGFKKPFADAIDADKAWCPAMNQKISALLSGKSPGPYKDEWQVTMTGAAPAVPSPTPLAALPPPAPPPPAHLPPAPRIGEAAAALVSTASSTAAPKRVKPESDSDEDEMHEKPLHKRQDLMAPSQNSSHPAAPGSQPPMPLANPPLTEEPRDAAESGDGGRCVGMGDSSDAGEKAKQPARERITDAKKTMAAPKPIQAKRGADFYTLKVSLPECPSGSFSKVEVQHYCVRDKTWFPSKEVPPAILDGAEPNSTVEFKLMGLDSSRQYRARSRARGRPDSDFGQWSTESERFQTAKDGQAGADEGVPSLNVLLVF